MAIDFNPQEIQKVSSLPSDSSAYQGIAQAAYTPNSQADYQAAVAAKPATDIPSLPTVTFGSESSTTMNSQTSAESSTSNPYTALPFNYELNLWADGVNFANGNVAFNADQQQFDKDFASGNTAAEKTDLTAIEQQQGSQQQIVNNEATQYNQELAALGGSNSQDGQLLTSQINSIFAGQKFAANREEYNVGTDYGIVNNIPVSPFPAGQGIQKTQQ
jgi:hypothetical protein